MSEQTRLAKYRDAITVAWTTRPADVGSTTHIAHTVMDLADAEQAELRAEVARLEHDLADAVADINDLYGRLVPTEDERDEARATIARVEALADEVEQIDPRHRGLDGDRVLARLRAALKEEK